MSPKAKKSLILSGIIGGAVAAPILLPLIPYAVQHTLVNKEIRNNPKAFFDRRVENAIADSGLDTKVADLEDAIKALEAEYNAFEDKTTPEAQAKKAELDTKKEELVKAKADLEEVKTEATYKATEVLAQLGDATINKENEKYTAQYVVLAYADFKASLAKLGETVDVNYPNKEDVEKISEFYQSWIDKFDKINKNNLNVTSTAWVNGLKYDWEIAKSIYASESRLVGSYLEWGLSYAYPINAFYDTISEIKGPTATKVLNNLKEGLESNVVLSKVVIKNNVKAFLSAFYSEQLLAFAKGTETEKLVSDIINSNTTLDKETKDFHLFYVNEYYKGSDHGQGEDLADLKVLKANTYKEVENTIEVFDETDNKTYKVYGLGLTEKDLTAKNVGLNSIKGSESTTTGKKIYDSILKFSTTSNDSAQEVFESGYQTSKKASENMILTAKAVAKLITGTDKGVWNPTVKYDADGLGEQEAADTVLNIRDAEGNINLPEFNKWMNQEQFFFGREESTYYTPEVKQALESDPKLADAIKNLKNLGYEPLKGSNEKYGSITNDQFYYGALEAFKGYNQFRDATMEEGFSYFPNQVPRYGITTYQYSRRGDEGVGAYNERAQVEKDAFGAFMFNADPYYSLPKWSVTSFANHESVMGHHNQIYYAQKFLKTIDGLTIGDIFSYTSYVEGWALFMEWFGIEAGLYGTPDFESTDYYALPKDFRLAKGITNFLTTTVKEQVTDEQVAKIKDLHGGVYWKLAVSQNEINDDKEHALKAVELANMLQYFGALNEAQLRNMRRAVDTAYHGDLSAGKEDLPAGASIKDVRAFLTANSALGIGDITSESKRYLNLPGQATSYNSGKEAMLKLYDRVRKSKYLTRENFVSNKENIKEFLNLLLETGALPLDTLKEIVELHYKL
ncbi:DUF885 family protein [Mycoplasmopsis arginini]|uniref:DUF885 family protein n=1 Tax=Mycoplasmopsis arginini TaxID=2094 RepID=UPI003CFFCC53